jgi:2-keto-4-pentenoate hydratase/2-oxohepta-3-ene-1,7-dioic acid hydratase in catechol pathway
LRICRFNDNRLGLVDGASVRDVTAALEVIPAARYPFPTHDALIAHLGDVLARAQALAPAAPVLSIDSVRLLSPVANPGKLVAAPVNYEKHLAEVKSDASLHQNTAGHTLTIHKAGVFLKATSSLAGAGDGVELRVPDRRTDHEVELAFVMGARPAACRAPRRCATWPATRSGSTSRFAAAKTAASASRPTATACSALAGHRGRDPGSWQSGSGDQRQRRAAAALQHPAHDARRAELIEMASAFYTLHPGDVVFTGTPEGVSPIEPGDEIVATIQSIGSMSVRVRAAGAASVPAGAAATTGA